MKDKELLEKVPRCDAVGQDVKEVVVRVVVVVWAVRAQEAFSILCTVFYGQIERKREVVVLPSFLDLHVGEIDTLVIVDR